MKRLIFLHLLLAFVWVSQGFRTLSGAQDGLDNVMRMYHSAGAAKMVFVPAPGVYAFICNDAVDDCVCEASGNADCHLESANWVLIYRAPAPDDFGASGR